MNLQTRDPDLATGELTVYVNGSNMRNGGRGFAVIQLDELGHVDLVFNEPEEFDRLIIAASAGKQKLINARAQHDFHPGDGNRCLDCGVLRAHHTEPVITDSERTCDQANPESGSWCHRTDEPGKCACSHPKGSHLSGSPRPCAMTGCDCGKFRVAASDGPGGVLVGPFDDEQAAGQ